MNNTKWFPVMLWSYTTLLKGDVVCRTLINKTDNGFAFQDCALSDDELDKAYNEDEDRFNSDEDNHVLITGYAGSLWKNMRNKFGDDVFLMRKKGEDVAGIKQYFVSEPSQLLTVPNEMEVKWEEAPMIKLNYASIGAAGITYNNVIVQAAPIGAGVYALPQEEEFEYIRLKNDQIIESEDVVCGGEDFNKDGAVKRYVYDGEIGTTIQSLIDANLVPVDTTVWRYARVYKQRRLPLNRHYSLPLPLP
jgi:hypothetical protein